MGVARIFSGGGGGEKLFQKFFQKNLKTYSQNFQKMFTNSKIFQKYSKNFKTYSKIFKKSKKPLKNFKKMANFEKFSKEIC